MTFWTGILAILISALSLTVSAWVAVRSARVQKAQNRTDLLLKTVDLRLGYASFNRRIRSLRDNPPLPTPKEGCT